MFYKIPRIRAIGMHISNSISNFGILSGKTIHFTRKKMLQDEFQLYFQVKEIKQTNKGRKYLKLYKITYNLKKYF